MILTIRDYFEMLFARFGAGWNEFWFAPSRPHTLAVVRILTGLVALWLHLTLFTELVRFFGPGGLLPPETIHDLAPGRATFSYLNHLTTSGELIVAHSMGAAILVLFTLGLFTRITSVLSLVVVLSTIHRAPLLTAEVEPILTLVMFYLCLGPSGKCLSLDNFLRKRRDPAGRLPAPTWTTTIAIRLMQVHLAALYLVMALAKWSGDIWQDGSAVWWLVTRTEQRLVDFTWLSAFPSLINLWTLGIVLFEFSFALLVWNSLARPLLLGLAVVMWLSLALITGMVSFCLMMLVANMAFVSPTAMALFLDSLAARFAQRTSTSV